MSKIIYKQKGYDGREVGPIMASRQVRFEVAQDGKSAKSKSSSISTVEFKVIDCVSKITEEPLFILGSVEFIENYIGDRSPYFYPKWATNFLRREKIYPRDIYDKEEYFVKPRCQYKLFDAGVFKGKDIPNGDCYVFEKVSFVDEWRYYVANGEVLTSWWYQGYAETCENNPHGPNINHLPIPEDFCGTIDMGLLDTGELALVECHHPYAIGWYGDQNDIENYIKFLVEGFKYLKNN